MLVLVCDDDAVAARAAIDRISAESTDNGGDAVVIARLLPTAQSAFRSIATTKFDVVIIDLCLPVKFHTERPAPTSGPWLARAVARAHPGLRAPLVMWTNNVASTLDYRNQCRAFRHHGGHHIIDKIDAPRDQLRTLQAALGGQTWRPPEDDLTVTEREIIAYYAGGRSTMDIARTTHRGHQAVEAHITAIRQKLLGVPTPAGTAKGFGPVLAAASKDNRISWLPVEHYADPVGVFAEIDKG